MHAYESVVECCTSLNPSLPPSLPSSPPPSPPSLRYSMIVNDGMVTALNVEPDGTGLKCSLSNELLSQL